MKKYYDTIQDLRGNRVTGVQITVRNQSDLSLASIFSDDSGTVQANPFTVDLDGEFSFFAANGLYQIDLEGGGIDPESRKDVLLFDYRNMTVDDMVGFTTDGAVENDLLAWNAASSQYEPRTPLEAGLSTYFARVGAQTEGWGWFLAGVPSGGDNDAVFEITNQDSGRIVNFRSGAGDGVIVAWVTNDGGAEFSGDVVIQGDLVVNGTETILNTQTLEVEDNVIILNSGVTGTPTLNAGIEVERGTSANVQLIWNESVDRWLWQDAASVYHVMPGLDVADTWTAAQTFNGGVILPDGSSATPALRFGSDTGGNTGLYWAGENDMRLVAGGTNVLGIGNTTVTAFRELNMNGVTLRNPLDPTAGGHVGDRDYNDARYGQLAAANTWTQSQVIAKAAGDASFVIAADTDNNDEGDHPSIRLQQDGAATDYRIGLGYHDGDSASSWTNNLVFTCVIGATPKMGFSPDNGVNVYELWHDENAGARVDALTADAAPDGAADYVMTWDASAGTAKKVLLDNLPGGGGGVTDHGALTGLADDDHPQYLNNARGDARYLGISAKAADSNLLDALNSTQFLRSDTSDTMVGNLSVTGTITATGDITGLTSDRRLKKILGEIDSGIIVDSIAPIRHLWDVSKCDAAGFHQYDRREHFSFDALQVYEVLGESAAPLAPFDFDVETGKSKSGEDYRTYKERELLAVAWAEVRALRQRVANLEELEKELERKLLMMSDQEGVSHE